MRRETNLVSRLPDSAQQLDALACWHNPRDKEGLIVQPSNAKSAPNSADDLAQVERLIDDASAGVQQAVATDPPPSPSFKPFRLDHLNPTSASSTSATIDTLAEVELDLRIELGRTQMSLQEVLQLRDGSVVALDSFAGDPVNIFVNDRIVARGEILVMNDHFCVRVTELVGA